MVSQEIIEAQQNIAREEAKFKEAKSKIQQLDPRVRQTREQLQRATPGSQMKVRITEKKREKEKQQHISTIEKQEQKFQQDIAPTKFAIKDAYAYESAMKHYNKGMLAMALGFGALEGREKYWGEQILKQHGINRDAILSEPGGLEAYRDAIEKGFEGQTLLYQANLNISKFAPAPTGIVSESVWNTIKDTPLSTKVKGYIPQSQMDSLAKYNQSIQQKKKSFVEKYNEVEHKVSSKTTKPFFNWIAKKKGLKDSSELHEKFGTEFSKAFIDTERSTTPEYLPKWYKKYGEWVKPKLKATEDFTAGSFEGLGKGFENKPVKTTAIATTFFILPGVTGAIAKVPGVTAIASSVPGQAIGTAVKYGAPVLYGSNIFQRVSATEGSTREKGVVFGGIASTEIAPMVIGGYAGAKFFPKISGYMRTRGMKEIPQEEIIHKQVLKEGKTFPTAPKDKHYGIFIKEGKLYHSTPNVIAKPGQEIIVGKSSSELPGLYGSSKVSPHFLKVGGKTSFYGGKVLNPINTPTSYKITPSGFSKGVNLNPTGQAYVPAIKTEIEAIAPPDTIIKVGKALGYFKWRGVRVPLYSASSVTTAGSSAKIIPVITTGSSSYIAPSSYATTPLSYVLSYAGSKASGSQSTTSSITKPSYSYIKTSTTSSKPSSPTYNPPSYIPGKSSSYKSTSYGSSLTPYTPSSPPSSPTYNPPSYQPPTTPRRRKQIMKGKGSQKEPFRRSYETWVIRKGDSEIVSQGSTREKALDIGTSEVTKDLKATFFIKEGAPVRAPKKSTGEFRRYSRLFRKPVKRSRYKNLGEEVWIQKKKRVGLFRGRLSFRGEKEAIKRKKKFKIL